MMFIPKRRLMAGFLISTSLLASCAHVPSAPANESGNRSDSACVSSSQTQEPEDQTNAGGSASDQSQPEEQSRTAQPEQSGDGSGETEQTASGSELEQPVSGSAVLSTYDFSQPCPESPAVDNSYFEDAAFIGDSRTDGFMIYSGIGCGENLTSNGLSIFKLAEKKALTIDGKQYTLLEALALKQYGKVYLSLGVNELGYYNDKGFYDAYCQAIDAIRECQPNAVIYIQGLIPLNEDVIAATGGASYLTNEHLRVYNDLMQQAAQVKQVVFLDLYPEFVGEDGQLPADASKDGVHLRKSYCQQWLEYLKIHTVEFETLYPTQEEQV